MSAAAADFIACVLGAIEYGAKSNGKNVAPSIRSAMSYSGSSCSRLTGQYS